MINFGPDFKNKVALSPSRLDTYNHCSQKYYANYFLKIPDKGNSGSNRGNVLHDTMEFLEGKTNKKYKEKIITSNSVKPYKKVWAKVLELAKQYNVTTEEDFVMVDQFIVTALNYDKDPEEMVESFSEKSFDFEEIGVGLNYRVRGRFDKYYICKDMGSKSLYIIYRDYKGSKQRFDREKISGNLQGGIYQIALNVLHPEINIKDFHFLFVKFKDNPIQSFDLLTDSQLKGFKIYLTELQKSINNFGEKNVGDNLGILNYKMKNLCGPAKSGWICPHQNPLDYYVLLDENNNIVKSAFEESDLVVEKDGWKAEKRSYSGCLYFFNSEGKRRNLNYN